MSPVLSGCPSIPAGVCWVHPCLLWDTVLHLGVEQESLRSSQRFSGFLEICFADTLIEIVHLCFRRSGGEHVYGVFDNQLPAALKKLPFDRHLSLQNVRKVVSEADGYQPHLIAPELGYRRLIDGALGYFKGPAEASVDAVM